MNSFRKTIAYLLAVMMLASMICVPAYADEGDPDDPAVTMETDISEEEQNPQDGASTEPEESEEPAETQESEYQEKTEEPEDSEKQIDPESPEEPEQEETLPGPMAVLADPLPELEAPMQAAPLGLTVSYPETIRCGTPTEFTLTGTGGTGSTYKYYLNCVYLSYDGENYWVTDPSRASGYSENNKISFTFYASGSYQMYFYVMTDNTADSYFRSIITVNVDDPAYPTVEKKADNIVAECIAAGKTSDYDKALWLHDWLVDHCAYDNSFLYCGPEGALCRGTGTCEAYHRAYCMLLKRAGISYGRMTGNGHVWTAVKMEGNWYQVDVTWDASGYSHSSEVTHRYFGITDELMKMVHPDHKVHSGYESNHLECNYSIKSGDITRYSDPYVSTINAELNDGKDDFSIAVNSTMSDGYDKNIMYTVAAFYLSQQGWGSGSSITVDVSYDTAAKQLKVSRIIMDLLGHVPKHVEAKESTCKTEGNKEYWYCDQCDPAMYYTDRHLTVMADDYSDLIIQKRSHTEVIDPGVPATATTPGKTEGKHCSVCGTVTVEQQTIPPTGYTVGVTGQGLADGTKVYVDGVAYNVAEGKVKLSDGKARTLVTYTYNTGDNSDLHKVYPTGMKVWMLSFANDQYSIRRISSLDNILQYAGSSIRITGKKGIRMITGVPSGMRSSLMGSGVEGYTLLEYGTCLEFDSALNGKDLTLNTTKKSNYAYKKGVADPVFKNTGSQIQYTNVLVGFNNAQCKEDISMRSYVKLQSPSGETVTLYGGTIHRSIGYIAYQNRNAFSPGTDAYKFIWDIIHAVYGNQYDSEYKG